MGILSKFLSKGPGGPASCAKTILNAYNHFIMTNPGCDQKVALKFAIATRYQIIPKLGEKEIETCLSLSDTVGDLIALILYAENPATFHYKFIDDTFSELEEFFTTNAPWEISSLKNIPDNLSAYRRIMQC